MKLKIKPKTDKRQEEETADINIDKSESVKEEVAGKRPRDKDEESQILVPKPEDSFVEKKVEKKVKKEEKSDIKKLLQLNYSDDDE